MGEAIQRALNALGFYSKAGEVAGKMNTGPRGIPPEQILNKLKSPGSGVKKMELENSGFENAMNGVPRLTNMDARDFFQSKLPPITEDLRLSRDHSERDPNVRSPKPNFETYTQPGGKDYEERVLRIPAPEKQDGYKVDISKPSAAGEPHRRSERVEDDPDYARMGRPRGVEDFVNGLPSIYGPQWQVDGIRPNMVPDTDNSFLYSPHWQDTPNVIGHLRMKMREGYNPPQKDLFQPTFGKTLNIEEAQNDWGQQARTKGIRLPSQEIAEMKAEYEARLREYGAARDRWYDTSAQADRDAYERAAELYNQASDRYSKSTDGVIKPPDYVSDTDQWTNTLLKRALTVAAQKGAEGVQLTGGDAQSARWSGQDGVKSFYDNTVTPNLGRLVKSVDPTSQRFIGPMVDQMPGRESGKTLLHAYDANGFHYNTWGPYEGDDLNRQRRYIAENYPRHMVEERPYVETGSQDSTTTNPFFSLSSDARDKILREGFPFFSRGGNVDGDDSDKSIESQIIEEAHELARRNPDLVRKALSILQAHAGQGDME